MYKTTISYLFKHLVQIICKYYSKLLYIHVCFLCYEQHKIFIKNKILISHHNINQKSFLLFYTYHFSQIFIIYLYYHIIFQINQQINQNSRCNNIYIPNKQTPSFTPQNVIQNQQFNLQNSQLFQSNISQSSNKPYLTPLIQQQQFYQSPQNNFNNSNLQFSQQHQQQQQSYQQQIQSSQTHQSQLFINNSQFSQQQQQQQIQHHTTQQQQPHQNQDTFANTTFILSTACHSPTSLTKPIYRSTVFGTLSPSHTHIPSTASDTTTTLPTTLPITAHQAPHSPHPQHLQHTDLNSCRQKTLKIAIIKTSHEINKINICSFNFDGFKLQKHQQNSFQENSEYQKFINFYHFIKKQNAFIKYCDNFGGVYRDEQNVVRSENGSGFHSAYSNTTTQHNQQLRRQHQQQQHIQQQEQQQQYDKQQQCDNQQQDGLIVRQHNGYTSYEFTSSDNDGYCFNSDDDNDSSSNWSVTDYINKSTSQSKQSQVSAPQTPQQRTQQLQQQQLQTPKSPYLTQLQPQQQQQSQQQAQQSIQQQSQQQSVQQQQMQQQQVQQRAQQSQIDIICGQEHKLEYAGSLYIFSQEKLKYNLKYQTFLSSCFIEGKQDLYGTFIGVSRDHCQQVEMQEININLSDMFVNNYLKQGRVSMVLLCSSCGNANISINSSINSNANKTLIVNIYQQYLNTYRTCLLQQFTAEEKNKIFNYFANKIVKNFNQILYDDDIKRIRNRVFVELNKDKFGNYMSKNKQYNYMSNMDNYFGFKQNDSATQDEHKEQFQEICDYLYQQLDYSQLNQFLYNNLIDFSEFLAEWLIQQITLIFQGNKIQQLLNIVNGQYSSQDNNNGFVSREQRKQDFIENLLSQSIQEEFDYYVYWLYDKQKDYLKQKLLVILGEFLFEYLETNKITYKKKQEIVNFIQNTYKNYAIQQTKQYFNTFYYKYFIKLYTQQQKEETYYSFISMWFYEVLIVIMKNKHQQQIQQFYQELIKIINYIKQQYNCGVIICGDMNTKQNDQSSLQQLYNELQLKNSFDIADEKNIKIDLDKAKFKACENYYQAKDRITDNLLDYVMVEQSSQHLYKVLNYHLCDVLKEKIIFNPRGRTFVKDHDPLIVSLEIVNQNKQAQKQLKQYQQSLSKINDNQQQNNKNNDSNNKYFRYTFDDDLQNAYKLKYECNILKQKINNEYKPVQVILYNNKQTYIILCTDNKKLFKNKYYFDLKHKPQ